MFKSVKHFARHMLKGNALKMQPIIGSAKSGRGMVASVLYRDGSWQVEIIVMPAFLEVKKHKHNHVDSCDVAIAGGGLAIIDGDYFQVKELVGKMLATNLLSVGKGIVHSGRSGENGIVFISFQKWDCDPVSILDDWQDAA